IVLQPLQPQHIAQLLVDSFRVDAASAAPLAQLLASRTQGNPLFVSMLLHTFQNSGLMKFDFAAGRWCWQLEAMQQTPVQSDVVDLVLGRMQALSSSAQTMLQYASCIGNTASLHILLLVTELPVECVANVALELEQAGMLFCVQNAQDLLLLAHPA